MAVVGVQLKYSKSRALLLIEISLTLSDFKTVFKLSFSSIRVSLIYDNLHIVSRPRYLYKLVKIVIIKKKKKGRKKREGGGGGKKIFYIKFILNFILFFLF